MRPRSGWLLLATCLLLAGCATRLERPVEPYASKVLELAPGASYETCLPLLAEDRLLFSYKADPPMAFAVLQHAGDTTVSFLMREHSRDEGGIFFVPRTADYCLRWTPPPDDVPWPTLLRFNLRLNPRG